MIILKSIGGLGNQMFQVAFSRCLSLELNEEIYIDISSYNKYKIRDFSLDHLNISEKVHKFSQADLNIFQKNYLIVMQKIYHVLQKIIKILLRTDCIGESIYHFYVKKGLYFNFDNYYYNNIAEKHKVKCVYGYFQSEEYFKKYKKQLKEEMKVKTEPTLKEQKMLDEIINSNAIAVSMRLGDDYKKSPNLNVCTDNYYVEGIDYLLNKTDDAKIFIFSDDIERAKKIIADKYDVCYVEGFKDYESLRLLYSCKHFVISNSSFSWWGAYLSDNDDKKIVAPSRWYNNSKKNPDIYSISMDTIEV